MKRTIFAIAMAATAACSSEPAPNCEQAFAHFYDAGCTVPSHWYDGPETQFEATNACQHFADAVTNDCRFELDHWLWCIDETSPAVRCDCMVKMAEMLQCTQAP